MDRPRPSPARSAAAWLSAAVGAPFLGLAWLARPKWRSGVGERLGRVAPAPAGAIWVHGASVGEATAALRLVAELEARGHAVHASATTATGRAVLAGRAGLSVSLAPLDHPLAVAAALERVRPAALVLVETELWPSWIAGASRRGVPVVIVSGRLSDGSFPRYQRLRRLFAGTLERLTAVAARSEEDARRFEALGVSRERISVSGDLKLDPSPPAPLAEALAARLGDAPLLVAGSTHEGEEAGAVEALGRLAAEGRPASLVLAPRHPERFERVARWLADAAVPHQRRSAPGKPLRPGEVLLLDSVGELAGVYARAVAAFVGGSWVKGVGGHNVLEPVFAGRPVSFGPNTPNARVAAELLLASGAGEVVEDAAGLARAWARDLDDPEAADRRGAAGRAALVPHEGAARRAADRVEAVLEASRS